MKIKFLILILVLISYSSFSQNKIILEGNVIGEKTKEYVPYAHIQVLQSNLGTVSDGKGKFRFVITQNPPGAALRVSCIGFKTRILKIPSGSEKRYSLTISLEEDVAARGAVTVFSGDVAKGLVKEAIDRIDRNYPAGEERLEGFYREQLSADSLFSNPYYVAEAILEVKKGSYKKKVKNGDVKVLKGRKYQGPSYDSLQMRFYAGTHIPHRHDFVMRREGPLNERNLNKYDFKILDTLRFEKENLIVVSFRPVRGVRGSGELYISQDSFAFVKGVFPDEEERHIEMLSQYKEFVSGYKRSYRKYVTEYAKQDTLWRLRYSAYETAFKNEEEAFYFKSVFTTTDFDTTEAEIPYAERIHIGDVFLEKTGEYDVGFWDEYIIVSNELILQGKNDQKHIDWNNKKGLSRRDKILKIASRFRTTYSLFYCQTEINPVDVSYNLPPGNSEIATASKLIHNSGLVFHTGYEFSRHWILGYEEFLSFSSKAFSSQSLTLSREIQLNPSKRPVNIISGFKMGRFRQQFKLTEFATDQAFYVNGKKFDSDKVEVFVESRAYFLSPYLNLSVEKSRRFSLYAGIAYNFPLKESNGLHLYEKDQFLFKKNLFVENNRNNPFIKSSSGSIFRNNIIFSLGVIWSR